MKWSKIVQHFRSFLWSMVVFGKGKVIVGRILSGLGKAFSAFKKIIRRKIFLGMKSNDYMYIECHLYLGIQQKSTPPRQHPPLQPPTLIFFFTTSHPLTQYLQCSVQVGLAELLPLSSPRSWQSPANLAPTSSSLLLPPTPRQCSFPWG